jgi:elongation factor P
MQTVLPSEFKRGMALFLDGAPQVIDDFHVSGTAQTKHKLHVRLRNLKSGHLTERVFADNERVPTAEVQMRRVQYSFQQGDTYAFLDAETYEELDLGSEKIGERRWFLKENEEYRALLLEGKLLDIELPSAIPLRVVETAPAHRGGADAAWKEAKVETGLDIMVPLFIDKGDVVRVDTHTRKYVGKE